MATYTDRMNGIKDVSFEEASATVRDDVRRQLVKVYFKDEPEFVDIMEDDEAYEKIYEEVVDSEGIREAYEVHCRRRCAVRFAGVLHKCTDCFPPRIANRVAMELGVKHVALHLKRSAEFPLTKLQRLKLYNKALKMEATMLEEDLEWNDDLNDDMFNEIMRFERNVERERDENEKLVLKGKARKAEIELLNYVLLNEFGVEPAKKEKGKKAKGKKKGKSKNKEMKRKEIGIDMDEEDENMSPKRITGQRGFTSIVKP